MGKGVTSVAEFASRGGRAAAAKMTAKERTERAKKAAKARWQGGSCHAPAGGRPRRRQPEGVTPVHPPAVPVAASPGEAMFAGRLCRQCHGHVEGVAAAGGGFCFRLTVRRVRTPCAACGHAGSGDYGLDFCGESCLAAFLAGGNLATYLKTL